MPIVNGHSIEPGADLSNIDLTGANLSGIDLSGANLRLTNLTGANLSDANLSGSILEYTNLTQANLTGANLTGVTSLDDTFPPRWVNLTGADLTGANLSGVDLVHCNLSDTILTKANLSNANLNQIDFSSYDFTESDLSGADLMGANLTGVNLTDTLLIDANLDGVKSGGITGTSTLPHDNYSIINGYIIGPNVNLTDANLTGANLGWFDLSGANLANANINGVTLSRADLSNTDLTGLDLPADLYEVNLSGSTGLSNDSLTGANIKGGDLNGLDLSGFNLNGTNLMQANLVGANLTGVDLTNTNLTDANLSGANLNGAIYGDNLTQGQLDSTTNTPENLELVEIATDWHEMPTLFLNNGEFIFYNIVAPDSMINLYQLNQSDPVHTSLYPEGNISAEDISWLSISNDGVLSGTANPSNGNYQIVNLHMTFSVGEEQSEHYTNFQTEILINPYIKVVDDGEPLNLKLNYEFNANVSTDDGLITNAHGFSGVLINTGSVEVDHNGVIIPAYTAVAPDGGVLDISEYAGYTVSDVDVTASPLSDIIYLTDTIDSHIMWSAGDDYIVGTETGSMYKGSTYNYFQETPSEDGLTFQFNDGVLTVNSDYGITTAQNIDRVYGTRFDDVYIGDDNYQNFRGEGGSNTFTGGQGADSFRLKLQYDDGALRDNEARITDFEEVDKIGFESYGFSSDLEVVKDQFSVTQDIGQDKTYISIATEKATVENIYTIDGLFYLDTYSVGERYEPANDANSDNLIIRLSEVNPTETLEFIQFENNVFQLPSLFLNEGEAVSYQIVASDNMTTSGDTIIDASITPTSWWDTNNVADWLSIDDTGLLQGTSESIPSNSRGQQNYHIDITYASGYNISDYIDIFINPYSQTNDTDQQYYIQYDYGIDELDISSDNAITNPHNYSGALINAGSVEVHHDGLTMPAFTSIAPDGTVSDISEISGYRVSVEPSPLSDVIYLTDLNDDVSMSSIKWSAGDDYIMGPENGVRFYGNGYEDWNYTNGSPRENGLTFEFNDGVLNVASEYGTITAENVKLVYGTSVDDTFIGDENYQNFRGDGGNDTYTGGVGPDRFRIEARTNDSGDLIDQFVRITDFEGEYDKLSIEAYGFDMDDMDIAKSQFTITQNFDDHETYVSIDTDMATVQNMFTLDGIYYMSSFYTEADQESITIKFIENPVDHHLIIGTTEDDDIEGTTEDDKIYGLEGNDIISGLDGDDIILGGNGNDVIWGGEGNDILLPKGGDDYVYGENGDDILILQKSGTQSFDGGQGEDLFKIDATNWTINFNEDYDQVIEINLSTGISGQKDNTYKQDTLKDIENVKFEGSYDTEITGDDGNNLLISGSGNDKIYGGKGNDILKSGSGNDFIIGGDGYDIIISGSGSDVICISSGDGSSSLATTDRITDFEDGSDVIGMAGVNYSDFTIAQGTDSYALDTILSISGDYVGVIVNTIASNINEDDFMVMPTEVETSTFSASVEKWQPDGSGSKMDGPSMRIHHKDREDLDGYELVSKGDGHPGHKHKPDMDKGNYELRVEHHQETDGAIDIEDVMGVLSLSRGISSTNGNKEHELAADWNGDGLIDIEDVMGVLSRSRGLNKDDEWRFHDKTTDTSLWDNDSKTNKLDITLDGDDEIDLSAILRGDVNGSYNAALHNRSAAAAPEPLYAPLPLQHEDELVNLQLDVV